MRRAEWGGEWRTGLTGGAGGLFSDLQTELLNAAVSKGEEVGGKAARGLISTESRASAEWGILIQQHYRLTITLPIQPQNQLSWAELTGLFSLHHLRSWQTSLECTSTSTCTTLRPATSPLLRVRTGGVTKTTFPMIRSILLRYFSVSSLFDACLLLFGILDMRKHLTG